MFICSIYYTIHIHKCVCCVLQSSKHTKQNNFILCQTMVDNKIVLFWDLRCVWLFNFFFIFIFLCFYLVVSLFGYNIIMFLRTSQRTDDSWSFVMISILLFFLLITSSLLILIFLLLFWDPEHGSANCTDLIDFVVTDR